VVNVVLIVVLLLVSPSLALAEKTSGEAKDWQSGIVLECEIVSVPTGTSTTGSVSNPDANGARVNANTVTRYDNWQRFEIETDTHVYRASQRVQGGFLRNGLPGLLMRRTKPAVLTVNGPVKYRLQKDWLVILDENEEQHKLSIVKKTVKRNSVAP
jgi:hypothetical protein